MSYNKTKMIYIRRKWPELEHNKPLMIKLTLKISIIKINLKFYQSELYLNKKK